LISTGGAHTPKLILLIVQSSCEADSDDANMLRVSWVVVKMKVLAYWGAPPQRLKASVD